MMKKTALIFSIAMATCFFCSCMGDHSASHGKDTDKSMYGNIARDTTKADSTGADTSQADNGASGGATSPKPDTAKKNKN